MSYTPQPGTIPYRVVEFLRKQPKGADVAQAVIAHELEIRGDIIGQCLDAPERHGMLVSQRRDGRRYWRLGDGTPKPAEPDDDPPTRRVVKAKASQRLDASQEAQQTPGDNAREHADRICLAAESRRHRAPPQQEQAQERGALRFAVWSCGTLDVRAGRLLLLTMQPDEARALADYMVRVGVAQPQAQGPGPWPAPASATPFMDILRRSGGGA